MNNKELKAETEAQHSKTADILPSAPLVANPLLGEDKLKMDLALLLDYVLPSGGILYKHCNGSWDFCKSDESFQNGVSYMNQNTDENVHNFLERLVKQLIKDEENEEEKIVAIDYAIWSNYKERP